MWIKDQKGKLYNVNYLTSIEVIEHADDWVISADVAGQLTDQITTRVILGHFDSQASAEAVMTAIMYRLGKDSVIELKALR